MKTVCSFMVMLAISLLTAYAQAQSCNCPKGYKCQCVGSNATTFTFGGKGTATGGTHLPSPETLVAGLRYFQLPSDTEKEAFLQTLPASQKQELLNNAEAIKELSINLHNSYQTALRQQFTQQDRVLLPVRQFDSRQFQQSTEYLRLKQN
jgi:hypothetical protein